MVHAEAVQVVLELRRGEAKQPHNVLTAFIYCFLSPSENCCEVNPRDSFFKQCSQKYLTYDVILTNILF